MDVDCKMDGNFKDLKCNFEFSILNFMDTDSQDLSQKRSKETSLKEISGNVPG